jgi:VWFA-related protein
MNVRLRFAGLFLLLGGSAIIVAQSTQTPTNPTPTFKAQVEYVEVDALVTDAQGRFVRDLTKDDFQVFEDGKRQSISDFVLVDIPIERAERPLFAAKPIEPDVYSNAQPFEGRVYVMILDDLHVAPLRSQRVKIAARQFIERNLGANDLMAIVFTGGRTQDAQDFTNNKRLLLAAVDHLLGRKLESSTLTRNDEYYKLRDSLGVDQNTFIADPEEAQRVANTRSMLSSIKQVAEWFGGVRGRRKTLLLFSEGIDYDLTDVIRPSKAPSSAASFLLDDIRDAISAAARSNVSIYAVDPRGLTDSSDDSIAVGSFADSDNSNVGIGSRSLSSELRVSQDSLRELADETGGFAAVNRNDFSSAFDRIVADNSSYYVLAYYPPSDKRDGKFHRIEVKVNRPGLVVRSRRGYLSPRGKPSPQTTKTGGMAPELFEAINSPLQVSGLTMQAFTAPFKGTSPNASVLVGVELLGRDLTLDGNGKVNVALMAVDTKAKVQGLRNETLTLNLRPENRARVEQSGLRVLSRLDLPPGRYQLRIAARDISKATVGSILTDLEVPDYFKARFSISGLTLTSLGSGAIMTVRPDEQLRTVLPAAPVAQRAFAQNDELALFAEVYDNSGDSAHKVDIVTSVRNDEGQVLFKTEETRDSSELQGAKGGYGYAVRVPLTDVPPGLHVLSVEARSRLGHETVAERLVQFRVLPRSSPQ